MDQQTGIEEIRQACHQIGRELMRIHPAVPSLGEKALQDEIYQILFRLTKEVETIKKRLIKLENQERA
ncbi:MAG: hypothetical protein AAB466_13805 [Verrucomicrobiota bacterium]